MDFFKAAFDHISHKHSPVTERNMPLDIWCYVDGSDPTRFVEKVELCRAATAGRDAWGDSVPKTHYHTLLRVFLTPTPDSRLRDTLLVERVLSVSGEYHSVAPISETVASGGSLFHPDIHDRVCFISENPSSIGHAHHLEVERTATFADGNNDGTQLTLAQFAQVLKFVSRASMLTCSGGDCKFQSRSFAFTCMAALTPRLPAPMPVRNTHEGAGKDVEHGTEMVDDSVFEFNAELFLRQIPWLLNGPSWQRALELIRVLKEQPLERAGAHYH